MDAGKIILPDGDTILVDRIGQTSDGYHTFDELYHYRALYNAGFFNELNTWYQLGVKSWNHSDGQACFSGGWFVVTAELPTGQISNHYPERYWDLFQIPEVDTAPEWDGHTSQQAAERLEEYLRSLV